MSCGCQSIHSNHKTTNIGRLRKSKKELKILLAKLDSAAEKVKSYTSRAKYYCNFENCECYKDSSYADTIFYDCDLCCYDRCCSSSQESSCDEDYLEKCGICEIKDTTFYCKKFDCELCRKCYDLLQNVEINQVKKVQIAFEIPQKQINNSKKPCNNLNKNLNEIWSLLTSDEQKLRSIKIETGSNTSLESLKINEKFKSDASEASKHVDNESDAINETNKPVDDTDKKEYKKSIVLENSNGKTEQDLENMPEKERIEYHLSKLKDLFGSRNNYNSEILERIKKVDNELQDLHTFISTDAIK